MMYKTFFKCTFLSDIVLNAHTATQGPAQSLDYIPGANFLGIVARDYSSFGEQSFDVFHSGKVRFGDAHISEGSQRSIKMPLSWFYKKTTNYYEQEKLLLENIYIHHKLGRQKEEFRKNGVQLKQIRRGFFLKSGKVLIPDHFFSIKSSYDLGKRRAKDSQMYGYDALRAGSEWIFHVESEDATLLEKITKKLEGKHRIGRSRSCQYGRVKIEKLAQKIAPVNCDSSAEDERLVLYAESSLAFFDKYGEPTLQPELQDLSLPSNAKILWQESQIRPRIFAPWNGVRKTRDADRVCIAKGSVIVVQIEKSFDVSEYIAKVAKGIGVYLNEGMGKILVNPTFLKTDKELHPQIFIGKESFESQEKTLKAIIEADDSDATFLNWIKETQKRENSLHKIFVNLKQFIDEKSKKFEDISASQWGAIRAIAQNSKSYEQMEGDLFQENKENPGFLQHGKSEVLWSKKDRKNILWKQIQSVKENIDKDYARIFTIKLCEAMAKRASQKKS